MLTLFVKNNQTFPKVPTSYKDRIQWVRTLGPAKFLSQQKNIRKSTYPPPADGRANARLFLG
ncbi:hypothetical protein PS906_03055 [Pseudomonas fluorescens]|nr:hypothetical protein PS906_03055 [Pseudomonas fluorescens]